jgi:NTP pyrophosphatase (non-canonical NTP hydrolase)
MTTQIKLSVASNDDVMNHVTVLADIEAELARIHKKWGPQNHAPVVWLSILTEEVGEVAKAINDSIALPTSNLYDELIQAASVAIQAAQCLRRNHPSIVEGGL